MKFRSLFDNDAFVREEPVYLCELYSYSDDYFYTNQKCTLSDFSKNLSLYSADSDNARAGVSYLLMLDRECKDDELLSSMVNNLIKNNMMDLPFYAYRKKIGKGYYVFIYVCDRFFYPEEQEIVEYVTSDRYINPDTGKMCKKDAENALLVSKKGDIKRSYKSHFSKKVKLFRYATSDEFKFKMERLKEVWVKTLKEMSHTKITNDISIKKLKIMYAKKDFKEQSIHTKRRNSAYWNKVLRKIEDKLSESLFALEQCDLDSDDNIKKLLNLRNLIYRLLIDGSFKYEKNRKSIEINLNSKYRTTCEVAKMFYDMAVKRCNSLINDIVNNSEMVMFGF